jgi:hypothetical protein
LHNEKDSNARDPQWKKLYETAILELDPTKAQLRISEAHEAILDRVEQLLTRPSDSEQQAPELLFAESARFAQNV